MIVSSSQDIALLDRALGEIPESSAKIVLREIENLRQGDRATLTSRWAMVTRTRARAALAGRLSRPAGAMPREYPRRGCVIQP
jgi:hypothetical protein